MEFYRPLHVFPTKPPRGLGSLSLHKLLEPKLFFGGGGGGWGIFAWRLWVVLEFIFCLKGYFRFELVIFLLTLNVIREMLPTFVLQVSYNGFLALLAYIIHSNITMRNVWQVNKVVHGQVLKCCSHKVKNDQLKSNISWYHF